MAGGVFGSIMSCCVVWYCDVALQDREALCAAHHNLDLQRRLDWTRLGNTTGQTSSGYFCLSPVCSILVFRFLPPIKNELLLFGFFLNKILTTTTSILMTFPPFLSFLNSKLRPTKGMKKSLWLLWYVGIQFSQRSFQTIFSHFDLMLK